MWLECTECLANVKEIYWQITRHPRERLDAVDGGHICRSCVRLIEIQQSVWRVEQ